MLRVIQGCCLQNMRSAPTHGVFVLRRDATKRSASRMLDPQHRRVFKTLTLQRPSLAVPSPGLAADTTDLEVAVVELEPLRGPRLAPLGTRPVLLHSRTREQHSGSGDTQSRRIRPGGSELVPGP
jgi:hypothetical protein